MESTTALMYVNIALWLGVGAFVAFLLSRQADMKKKIEFLMNKEDIQE